ncbi:unnamed protein product [Caenorhabditis sp. 36 PRJEB53466]|nr:unnamed protein product [Caenorhabditis sp. 36 PRJEB53466]
MKCFLIWTIFVIFAVKIAFQHIDSDATVNDVNRPESGPKVGVGKAEASRVADFSGTVNGLSASGTGVREPRAAQPTDFDGMVGELGGTAHIVTSIALQNGLIDGSIPADKAFSELMRIPSSDLKQLAQFDDIKVNAFFGKVKEVALKMLDDQAEQKAEKMIGLVTEWTLHYKKISSVSDMKKAKDYFLHVNAISQDPIDVSSLDTILPFIEKVILNLDKVILSVSNNSKSVNYYTPYYSNLHELLPSYKTEIEKFVKLFEILLKYAPLLDTGSLSATSQGQIMAIIDNHFRRSSELVVLDQLEKDDLLTGFSSTRGLFDESEAIRPDLASMQALVDSQTDPAAQKNLVFTSGYVHGYADLKTLPTDVQKTSLNDGFPSNVVSSGLEPLNVVADKTTSLETNWKPLADPAQSEAVRRAVLVHKDIRKVHSVDQISADDISKMSSCSLSAPVLSSKFHPITFLITASTSLHDHLVQFVPALRALEQAEHLKYIDPFDQLAQLIVFKDPNNPEVDELKLIIEKAKDFPHLDKMKSTLVGLKSVLSKIKTTLKAAELPPLVEELAGKESEIDTFVQNSRDYVQMFECYKGLAPKMQSLSTSIKVTKNMRILGKDTQFTANLKTVTDAISGSKPVLKSLDSVPDEMKKKEDVAEVMKLKALGGLGKEAKVFGDSVHAVVNVDKALKQKDKFENFLEVGSEATADIAKIQDPSVKAEIQNLWGDFDQTKTEVTELLLDLKTRKDRAISPKTMRRATTSGFAKWKLFFSHFFNMKSVDLHVEARLSALEKLKTVSPTATLVDSVNQALIAVKSADFDFSRFGPSLKTVETSLSTMDTIFANVSKSAPIPNAPIPPAKKPTTSTVKPIVSPTSSPFTIATPTAGYIFISTPYMGWDVPIFTVIVALIVGMLVLLVCWRHERCRWWAKKAKSDEKTLLIDRTDENHVKTQEAPSEAVVDLPGNEKKENKGETVNEQQQFQKPKDSEAVIKAENEQQPIVEENVEENVEGNRLRNRREQVKPNRHGITGTLQAQRLREERKKKAKKICEKRRKAQALARKDSIAEISMPNNVKNFVSNWGYSPLLLLKVKGALIQRLKSAVSNWFDHFTSAERVDEYGQNEFIEGEKHLDRCRGGLKCVSQSIKGLSNFFHMNEISQPLDRPILVGQGPSSAAENMADTRQDLLINCIKMKIETVVVCGSNVEDGEIRWANYIPNDKNEVLSFGDIAVKVLERHDGKEVIRKELLLTGPVDGKACQHLVTVYQFPKWKKGMTPSLFDSDLIEDICTVIHKLRNKKGRVFVHSSMGTDRACCFAGVWLLIQMIQQDQLASLPRFVREMQKYRFGAFSGPNGGNLLYLTQILATRLPWEDEEMTDEQNVACVTDLRNLAEYDTVGEDVRREVIEYVNKRAAETADATFTASILSKLREWRESFHVKETDHESIRTARSLSSLSTLHTARN